MKKRKKTENRGRPSEKQPIEIPRQFTRVYDDYYLVL